MRKLKTLKSVTETQVREMILEDPDAPEATDRQLRRAVPFAEAFPDLAARAKDGLVRRPTGRPRSEKKKTSVSSRYVWTLMFWRSFGAQVQAGRHASTRLCAKPDSAWRAK